jgi:hypothetical protein
MSRAKVRRHTLLEFLVWKTYPGEGTGTHLPLELLGAGMSLSIEEVGQCGLI